MKNSFCLYLLVSSILLLGGLPGWAQKAQSAPEAMRFIKLGNTLREIDKPQQAIDLLLRALPAVQGKDIYWEAIAYENLGLAYSDQENTVDAIRYFQKAQLLYKSLKYKASEAAMSELIDDATGKKTYAGIDIGSSGIKLAVFGTRMENGFYTKSILSKPDAPNVTLISGTPQAFDNGRNVLRAYMDSIRRYNIPPERIYVAFSSGINDGFGKTPGRRKQLYDLLTAELPKGAVFDTTLTASREAELFTVGAVPRKLWATTSCMDIGSGNTKGGYYDANRYFHALSFPIGTKSLAALIDKNKSLDIPAYRNEAQRVVNALADSMLRPEFSTGHVGLQQRRTVAFGGGIAWALVAYLHPEKAGVTAVPLTVADIERFKRLALTNYQALIHPDLTDLTDLAVRQKAEKDLGNVQAQFNEKQVIAGALWLDAVVRAYDNTTVPKRFVFIRDSDIGWVTGKFLEDLNRAYERTLATEAK
ncbi:tetratricopeptide repeat protein [Fibrella sp. HMF5335]|uniref:Tetratricopeptide repeat protein n=1 Tax=Fibrella rubiginis TaxID=2817060 RepID=A0A939K4E6_9BACT|nr:tetratricopeptide repeat protein [Fibrella rubiginis]MBO0936623.1 tetratricopeptide repeat protein [Fibrella rubiginis]